jgi:radical SAM protein with 4Fe4S-binding SPASM domain
LPVALSPSVTPSLTPQVIERMVSSGVTAVSISLDGALAATHDWLRGVPGHFERTIEAIGALSAAGLTVQVNTTVMRANLEQLADVAELISGAGAHIWEVFFLVQVGRGVASEAISPAEHEDVCHFLYDASQYRLIVRTVEAPFFRRVVACRRAGQPAPASELYLEMSGKLETLMGPATARPRAQTASTRDGKGILFVAHDGKVNPAGFLPLSLGNVRDEAIAAIYRDHPLLRRIRAADFTGRCGVCEYADLCGGSRARAFAAGGDPLGEDPACAYVPAGWSEPAADVAD